MPVPDDYGQGIQIASLLDAPDAGKLAKDIANALAQRGVMRFASASARGATITAPVEGMLAWLRDVDLLTLWDGSAWTVVATGAKSWTTVGLTSGWSHNGNDNGTFQYRLVNLFGEDSLMFRGAIGRSSYPGTVPGSWTLTNTALPSAVRPSTKRTISVPCSDINSTRITLKADIQPDGHITLWGTQADAKPPWVGFNGCFTSL
ncbi:hypothetical protein ACIQXD_05220 [Streptomyces uncialis]|uniref:hypothetical protein n=1 Tax=Streptomyces uncialis TaxID=1048205 RepID=UPI0037F13F58